MKINIKKLWAVGSIFAVMGSALVAFQNFVPHDSFRGHDTSDIYMNTALTDALKQAEKQRQAGVVEQKKPEAKVSGKESLDPELGRAPASIDETETK